MIDAQNIYYHIGSSEILKDVSTTLSLGEFVAVLGANGAGKTTLLRCLAGEIKPKNIRLQMDGRDYSNWSMQDLALRRSVLSQNIDISFQFQVMDVVLMGRYIHSHGYEGERDYEIAELALKHTDAYQFRDRIFNTLSGGEKQRVQLARVLAQIWDREEENASRYLFLDEPTSSLDIEHQYRMMTFIKRFATENVGIFCVLHDVNLAVTFADKIILLKDGMVLAQGPTKDVIQSDLIEKTYGIAVKVHQGEDFRHPFVVPVYEEV